MGARKGATSCGLWIRLGPDLALDVLVRDLKQIFFAINSSRYQRNMHALEISGDESDELFRKDAAALFEMARSAGIATILRGSAELAHEAGADGVLLSDLNEIEKARSLYGDDGIIGLACGLSNEDAAAAYDADVDFVSFGTGKNTMPDAEILKFWTMLTDLPAVIEGPVTNDYAAYYVQAGAGFIDCGGYIWSHGKGVMQSTVNMMHAIDVAIDKQQKPETQ